LLLEGELKTLAQSKFITPILVILIIVAGIAGYFAGRSGVASTTTTITVTEAAPGSAVTRTVTEVATTTVTATATAATAPKA